MDLLLLLLFTFQGLLSFSRGGMVGGFLGILIFIFVISSSSQRKKRKFNLPSIGKFGALSLIFLIIIFQIADSVSGGLLSLRYQGENNSTLAGRQEVSLNTLTTGRFDIFTQGHYQLKCLRSFPCSFALSKGAEHNIFTRLCPLERYYRYSFGL